MSQSFSLAVNSHAPHPLHQLGGRAAAPGTAEDHTQARHLRPDGTEAVDLQNAMTFIGPRLHRDHDLQFVPDHTLLDLAHRHPAEVVAQTRGIDDAGAQATAVMVTAAEVAVQTGTEATIDIER
jgi:hypothetical protein